ncbi:InlB B-repeat-containing protein [Acholeplasma sp. OttesenSCG-928-E16]|nr:InlB B-repeat-containing protein [Acholeplasma sp. OttesenSCG-928-E16]
MKKIITAVFLSILTLVGLFACNMERFILTVTSNDTKMGVVSGGGEFLFRARATIKATANDGYDFLGWYDLSSDDLLSEDESYTFAMPKKDYHVEGRFQKEVTYYSVTFYDGDDPITDLSIASIREGELIDAPLAPNKEGYSFKGWYVDSLFTTPYLFDEMPIKSNTSIYGWYVARTDANKFALTINSTQSGCTLTGGGEYEKGASVTILTTNNIDGYKFIGWYIDETLVCLDLEHTFVMPENDLIITARYEEVQKYQLSLSSNISGATLTGAGNYAKGETVIIEVLAISGYTFLGWYDGEDLYASDLEDIIEMPESNLSLVAKFEKIVTVLTVAEARLENLSEELTVSGVVTNIVGSKYVIISDADGNAALHIHKPIANSDLEIGDIVEVTGSLATYENLLQITDGATIVIKSSNNDIPAAIEATSIPTFTIDDQGIVYNFSSLKVVSYSSRNLTLSDGTNQIIARVDDALYTELDSYLASLAADQIINLKNVHIGWYQDKAQIQLFSLANIALDEATMIALIKDSLDDQFKGLEYLANSEISLPSTHSVLGGSIAWATNPANMIVDNKWINVTEDKDVKLVATITLGDTTASPYDIDVTVLMIRTDVLTYNIDLQTTAMVSGSYGTGYKNTLDTAVTASSVVDGVTETVSFVASSIGQPATAPGGLGNGSIVLCATVSDTANPDRVGGFVFDFGTEIISRLEFVFFVGSRDNDINNVTTAKVEYYDATLDTWVLAKDFLALLKKGTEITVRADLNASKFRIVYDGTINNANGGAMRPDSLKLFVEPVLESFDVIFNTLGGSTVNTQSVLSGTKATRPSSNPTKLGYTFVNWYTAETEGSVFDFDTLISADTNVYARWTKDTYNITYENLKDQTNSNPSTYQVDTATITLAPLANITGFEFIGWFDALTDGNEVESITLGSTGNKTIYARWAQVIEGQSLVLFDTLGGSSIDSQSIVNGNKATRPSTDPTKLGYTFDNWYTAETDGSVFDFDTLINARTTIYARWTKDTYTISYNYDGGSLEDGESNPESYDITSSEIVLLNPTRNGYTFLGWYSGTTKIESISAGSYGNLSLVANWQVITYEIQYSYNDGVLADGESNPESYNITSNEIVLLNPTKEGYTFLGWYSGTTKIESIPTGSYGDLSLVASFELNLSSIENTRKQSNETAAYFNGIVTGIYGSLIFVIDENGNYAIAVNATTLPETFVVGNKVSVNGTISISNGLVSVSNGVVALIDGNNIHTYPSATTIENISNLTTSDQGKAFNLPKVTVTTAYATSSRNIIVEDKAGNSIQIRVNDSNATDLIEKMSGYSVGDMLDLTNVYLGWFNSAQFYILLDTNVTETVLTDEETVDLIIAWLEAQFDNKSYNSGVELILPTTHPYLNGMITSVMTPTNLLGNDYRFIDAIENTDGEIVFTVEYASFEKDVTCSFTLLRKKTTYTEGFDTTATGATSSYGSRSFNGIAGTTWEYKNTRDQGDYSITGKGLMMQGGSNNSYIKITFPTGLDSLYFEYRKAFTGTFARRVQVTISDGLNSSVALTSTYGTASGNDATIHKFDSTTASWSEPLSTLNLTGTVIVTISFVATSTSQQTTFDNFLWRLPYSYTVSFDTDGGSTNPDSQSILELGKASAPTEPTKQGNAQYSYEFLGWYNGDDLWVFDTNIVSSNIALVAKWRQVVNEYTYTFKDYNGNTIKEATIQYGASIVAPDDPTRDPNQQYTFTFSGWDKAIPQSITEDIVFVAQYSEVLNKYDVTFNSNGGSSVSPQEDIEYGSYVIEPQVPSKDPSAEFTFAFAGWYVDLSDTEPWNFTSDSIVGDLVLIAKWTSIPIGNNAVTFDVQGGSPTPQIQSIAPGGYATEPSTNPQKNGYTFIGWFDAATGGNEWNFGSNAINEDITIYAQYSVITYEITYVNDGGNHQNTEEFTVETDTFSLEEATKRGYTFIGWFDAATEGNEITSIVKGTYSDISLWARFTLDEYDITYENMTGATNHTNNPSVYYVTSQDITLGAASKSGYVFDGWYTALTGGTKVETIAANSINDITLYARWTEILSLGYDFTGIVNDKQSNFTTTTALSAFNSVFTGQEADNKLVSFGDTITAFYLGNSSGGGEDGTNNLTRLGKNGSFTINFEGINIYKVEVVARGWNNASSSLSIGGTSKNITTKGTYSFDISNPSNSLTFTSASDDRVFIYNFIFYYQEISLGEQYTVSFNTDGATSETPVNQLVYENGFASAPDDPVKPGYTFTGWYDGTTLWNFDTSAVTKDVTLAAKYSANTNTVYKVHVYLEQADETFAKDSELSKTGTTAASVSYTPEAISGFTFDENNQSNVLSGTVAGDGSLVLYVYYTISRYTIEFDQTGVDAITGIKHGSTTTIPSLSVAGYTFNGWFIKEDGNLTTEVTSSTEITSNLSLYASLTPNTNTAYKVEIYKENLDGSYSKDSESSASGTTGTTASHTPSTISGYSFDSNNESNVLSGTIAGDGSLVLKAYYVRQSYDVTFVYNNGDSNGSETLKYGASITLPSPTKTGYLFDAWYTSTTFIDDNKVTSLTMPVGGTTLYANYTIVNYEISFEENGGTFAANPTLSYNYAASYTLPTNITKVGYDFAGWFDNEALEGNAITSITAGSTTGNKSYYAKWTDSYYDFSVTLNNSSYGSISITVGGEAFSESRVKHGTEVTIAVSANAGYKLVNIYDSLSSTSVYTPSSTPYSYQFTVTGKIDYVVNLDLSTNITYKVISYFEKLDNTYESQEGSPLSGTTGASVSTTPQGDDAVPGFTYDSSNSDNVLSGTIAADGSLELKVYYVRKTYTITFVYNNGETNGSETLKYGASVTLPSPTKTGYDFDAWYSSTTYIADNKVTSLTMPVGGTTLYANYALHSFSITYNTNSGTLSGTYPSSFDFLSETTLPTSSNITRAGYTFNGWYNNAALEGDAVTSIPTGTLTNQTFYAKWTMDAPTVSVSMSPEGGSSTYGTSVVITPSSSSLVPNSSLVYYHLYKGENLIDSIETGNFTLSDVGDSGTYYVKAQYVVTINEVDITYYGDSSTFTVTISTATPVASTHTMATFYVGQTFSNSTLSNFISSGSVTGVDSTALTGGTYTIKEAPSPLVVGSNDIVLTYTPANSNYSALDINTTLTVVQLAVTFDGITDPVNVNYGATLSTSDMPNVPALTHHENGRWVAPSDKSFENITSSFTATAVYDEISYTITFELNGGNDLTDPKSSYTISSDDYTLPTPTKTGAYSFGGWYEASDFSGNAVTTLDASDGGNKTYYAKWLDLYSLTVSAERGTAGTSGSYVAGASVSLTSTPEDSYVLFVGWFVGDSTTATSTDASFTYTMPAAATSIKAVYRVRTIAEVKALSTTNPIVKIQGVITSVSASSTHYYAFIQDATDGLYMYKIAVSSELDEIMVVGNVVEVIGTRGYYSNYSMYQIVDNSNLTITYKGTADISTYAKAIDGDTVLTDNLGRLMSLTGYVAATQTITLGSTSALSFVLLTEYGSFTINIENSDYSTTSVRNGIIEIINAATAGTKLTVVAPVYTSLITVQNANQITNHGYTESEVLDLVLSNIMEDLPQNESDITSNLSLISSTYFGYTISWSSSDVAISTASDSLGVVDRSLVGDADLAVVLTYTIKNGDTAVSDGTLTYTVKKYDLSSPFESVLYETDFEWSSSKMPDNNYLDKTYTISSLPQQWIVYQGGINVQKIITGEYSVNMAWYYSKATQIPKLTMDFSISDITRIEFDAIQLNRSSNTTLGRMIVEYSLDGLSWIPFGTERTLSTSSTVSFNESLPSEATGEIKIRITMNSSYKPNTGNMLIAIDNLKIYGMVLPSASYRATLNPDNGSPSTIITGINSTNPLTKPSTDPTKENYKFLGWYEVNSSTPFVFEEALTTNVQLIAKWALEYSISVSVLNSTGGEASASKASAIEGETISLTATPDTGYEFVGWFLGDATEAFSTSASITSYTMPGENLVVTAKFALLSYTVSFLEATNGSYTITIDEETKALGSHTLSHGTEVSLEATPSSGYAFSHWLVDSVQSDIYTTASITYPVSGEVDIVPVFSLLATEATLTISANTGGVVASNIVGMVDGIATIAPNDSVTVTATPSTNYRFIGWFEGTTEKSTSLSYTFNMTNYDLTLVAKFQETAVVTVQYATEGEFSNDLTYNDQTSTVWVSKVFDVGDEIELVAYPSSGYRISNSSTTDYTITGNIISITVPSGGISLELDTELITYQLTVSSSNSEHGVATLDKTADPIVSYTGGLIAPGATVTLYAVPASGYQFDGWYIGEDKLVTDSTYTLGTDSISFTMPSEAKAITVQFEVIPVGGTTVTAQYSGTTTNMADGNNAGTIGLNADLFTVTAIKGSAGSNVGLNGAGQIRLYGNKADGVGNTLEIEISSGYIITDVTFTFGATTQSPTALLTLGEVTENLAVAAIKNIDKVCSNLSITSFSIQNTHQTSGTVGQIFILSIQITYTTA